MNWFVEYRENWIAEMLEIYGFINRKHLVRKFRISEVQANNDIRDFLKKYPNSMIYNASTKRYEKED